MHTRLDTNLGIWPFDSEASNNLDLDIKAAAGVLKTRVEPNLSFTDKATAFFDSLTGANPYEQFLRDYMTVAKKNGHAYTDSGEYYTLWDPGLEALGWSKSVGEAMMLQIPGMIADKTLPADIADPANVKPPGNSNNPLDKLGDDLKSAAVKVGIFAIIGIAVYAFASGAGKGVIGKVP